MNSLTLNRSGLRPTWPTRLGTAFVALAFAIGFLAIVFSNNLYYLIVAMMLGFIAVSGLLAECTLYGLKAIALTPPESYAGGPALLSFELTNLKRRFPAFGLVIRTAEDGPFGKDRLRLAQLEPCEVRKIDYTVTFNRRGWHTVPGFWVATGFPFRLSEKAAFLPCPVRVLVYPFPRPIASIPATGASGDGDAVARSRGSGTAIHSVRDYVSGDPIRLIHWKRSARDGTLTVREMEQESHATLTLVLGSLEGETLDTAASVAAGLLVEAEGNRLESTLVTHAGTVGPGSGPSHLTDCLRLLAVLEPGGESWTPPALPQNPLLLNDGPVPPPWARALSPHVIDMAGVR
jgi:uncharacterized protein (DUF58 family)